MSFKGRGNPLWLFCFLFYWTCIVQAKSSYPEADYSEMGFEGKSCMRCHMALLNPAGANLGISGSASSVTAGQDIGITVTKSGFSGSWNTPGIVIHFEYNSPYASRVPGELGWEVVSGPKGKAVNYVVDSTMVLDTLRWTLKAPQRPGSYRIATSAYFDDGTTGNAISGTIRGGNSLAVTVTRASETVKPALEGVESRYKVYVFLRFSEAMDETEAKKASNYLITDLGSMAVLTIRDVSVSRDGKQVIIRTDEHQTGRNYSIRVGSLTDYAAIPNSMDQTSMEYTPDLVSPYKIYAEWTQDVTSSIIMEYDLVEYLGKDMMNRVHRVNVCWHIPDQAVDMLSGIPFVSAKVFLRQQNSARTTASPVEWDLHRLLPGSAWNEYVGSNLPVATLWSGCNQVAPALATLVSAVDSVAWGSPEKWWKWDITEDFRVRYQNPGGNGTNVADYFVRLKAKNEAVSAGPGFYGSDADLASRPYIELSLDTLALGASRIPAPVPSALVTVSPNPFSSTIRISVSNPGRDNVSLELFSVQGKKIRTLYSGPAEGGSVIAWDGKDQAGRLLPSGVFVLFYRVGLKQCQTRMFYLK